MQQNNSNKLFIIISVVLISALTLGAFTLKQNSKPTTVVQLETSSESTEELTETALNNNDISLQQTTKYFPEETYTSETTSESSVSYQPVIVSAETSVGEVLPNSNVNASRTFGAEKTIDGYPESCWCVNTANSAGAGGEIIYYLAEESYVSGIKIINGNLYLPEDELYSLNGQIRDFTLSFSDGSELSFTADFNSTASDSYQLFNFDNPILTEYIILTVDSGYTGSLYDTNVCLGEFDVF